MMKKYVIPACRSVVRALGLMALAGTQLPTWAAQPAPDVPAVVVLGGAEHISYDQLRDYARRRIDFKGLMGSLEGWKVIAREYALTRALVREGERAAIERPPVKPAEDADPLFLDDVYALKVFETLSNACRFENTESALKAYYDANPKAFEVPARVRIQRVMLPEGKAVGPLSASAWMTLQARAVTEGAAQFDKLIERAQEYAPDIYQGDLGWQVVDDRIDLLAALGDANVGNLVGPVREGDYWVLLRVIDKRPAFIPPWDAVRHQAHAIATQHCKESEHRRVMNELFRKYEVRIDIDALKRALASGAQR